jgi:hypothetical protein
MFLNGQSETMAFNKNNDHTLARDHMRVYYEGKDPQTGQDLWAIASTRDVAATVTFHPIEKNGFWPWQWHFVPPSFGHETDGYVDGERDLIMNDLLSTGHVTNWMAVNGQRPQGYAGSRQPDGLLKVGRYTTDGQVYQVDLG